MPDGNSTIRSQTAAIGGAEFITAAEPMIYLYRAIYQILKLVLIIYSKAFQHTKIAKAIALKTQKNNFDDLKIINPIWIHAASGEIEYARPVIRGIKKQFPNYQILVTYSSVSAEKILADIPEVDLYLAIPWDTPTACASFLNKYQPKIVLFSRTDVWPEMSLQISLRKIPSLLFSATFAKNSSRLRFPGRILTRIALLNLKSIYCVSNHDIENISPIIAGHPDLQARGDTRFDQAFYRLENPKATNESLFSNQTEKLIIFGSTWEEDENIILPALKELNGFRFIIAPHETEPSHLQSLEKRLQSLGLKAQRYSRCASWTEPILIIDQVGILAEIYQYGDVAFVGGSFKKQVHSVMEPLVAGLPVVVGPHYQNNREAIYFCENHHFVRIAQNSHELATAILTYCRDSAFSKAYIKTTLRSQTGASQAVLAWLQRNI